MSGTFILLLVLGWFAVNAQAPPEQRKAQPAAPAPATPQAKPASETPSPAAPQAKPASAAMPSTAGPGRPPVVVPASTDSTVVRLRLTLDAEPMAGDLEAGLLHNDQYPNQQIIPKVELLSKAVGADKTWELVLKVSGLIEFGDSTAALLHKGRQVETLRFHKAGLLVKPPPDGAFIAREGEPMLLVLENPSEFEYNSVKARLRFQGLDVCTVQADRFDSRPTPTTANDCNAADQWNVFTIPKYAQVSLRARTDAAWFRDAQTGFSRSAKRKGMLTLRFQGEPSSVIFEQNLPLDIQFEPGTWSLTKSLLSVAFWLIMGALLALVLRVTIPNYRRKKVLKDQLIEARMATREISDRVESPLRVLLRVERLALEQLRRDSWVLGPDFSDLAQKVETGLATLKRKIALVQRLDAALSRRDTLLAEPVSPTRFDMIERNLAAASQGLKSPQLTEQEWVIIQQRLEAADKALGEPAQEEKQAFEALLVQRWKALKDHFGLNAVNELIVPPSLMGMADAFPDASLLPKPADPDGADWVKAIGSVRVDLQVTALELIREFQFLAPALNDRWTKAMPMLTDWLATPAIQNLVTARSFVLQLAEGIGEEDIVGALRAGQARIELDPQVVTSNQKMRLEIRFRDPRLNGATARQAVECEWHFKEARSSGFTAFLAGRKKPARGNSRDQEQKETGWKIHHYFEEGVGEYTIEARFYYHGQPVTSDSGSDPVTCNRVVTLEEPTDSAKVWREKWLWGPAPQALQLFAALLVPLAALAVTTAGEGASGRWWDLVSLGFGSETIRNILTGRQSPTPG